MHTHAPDPLPLGEVEPKRGRGVRATYIRAIRLRPPPRRGSTPPAARAGVQFAWAEERSTRLRVTYGV